MSDLKKKLNDLLTTIETAKPNIDSIADLDAYERGKAEGHFDGMTSTAAQVRALLEDEQSKPLVPGCRVLVLNGPWADHHGRFNGLFTAPTGKVMAEVTIDNADLPFLIDQEHIKAV
jgi:hypothetical protein